MERQKALSRLAFLEVMLERRGMSLSHHRDVETKRLAMANSALEKLEREEREKESMGEEVVVLPPMQPSQLEVSAPQGTLQQVLKILGKRRDVTVMSTEGTSG